jgi:putative acetyltransferase
MIVIRPERDERHRIFAIHAAAFGREDEAVLVDRLREDRDILLSLMAVDDGEAVGNVILSRMDAEADGVPIRAVALAPIGVLPARQKQGIGGELVRSAIEWARDTGQDAIFLLGDPGYYGRFGFSAEMAAPFASPYAGPYLQALFPGKAFQLPKSGRADYAPAFAALGDA